MSVGMVLGIVVALGIFFLAIVLLKSSLARFEPVIGPLLRRGLHRPWAGVLAGVAATAVVQSSSATNAVAVGFVAAGLIGFPHAFAIALGANIGTTLTPQLAAFGSLEMGFLVLMIGLLAQLPKSEPIRIVGAALGGVGGMFIGLWAISGVMSQVLGSNLSPETMLIDVSVSDGVAMVYGMLVTGIVQSSSAVVSLLVGLAEADVLPVQTAIAAMIGANVGTVTTTILVALWGGAEARRTALADLLFNGIGLLVVWPFLALFASGMETLSDAPGRQVAHAHTIFNLMSVAVILPFIRPFCRIVMRLTAHWEKER